MSDHGPCPVLSPGTTSGDGGCGDGGGRRRPPHHPSYADVAGRHPCHGLAPRHYHAGEHGGAGVTRPRPPRHYLLGLRFRPCLGSYGALQGSQIVNSNRAHQVTYLEEFGWQWHTPGSRPCSGPGAQ